MNVWIVQVGEPLVGIDAGVKAGRANLLAASLVERGHEVTWWASTFDHFRKSYRYEENRSISPKPGLTVRLLHGTPSYPRNTSVRRLLNQRSVARNFGVAAGAAERPDVIFACLPTPEICERAVQFGRRHGIPVVVDIRDPWPDVYMRLFPRWLKRAGRVLLAPEYRRLARIVRGATGVTAVSETYLSWALGRGGRERQPADGVFPIGGVNPAGHSDGQAAADFAARHGIRRGASLVVFCGVFGATYDLQTVVECAALVLAAGRHDVQFVLAGGGDSMAALARRAAGLRNVVFTGWLDTSSIACLLRIATIGLSAYAPGAMQSLPNKPFEYMAAGLPQISSLRGEMEDLIRDHGIGRQYVAGLATSLRDEVVYLLEHPSERAGMAERARTLFVERFDASRIYPHFAAHLESIASNRAAALSESLV